MQKRKSNFVIVLLSAAITFGTLWATVGPRHFQHKHYCHNETAPSGNEVKPQ